MSLFENVVYVEALYARYRADPKLVPREWQDYFRREDLMPGNGKIRARPEIPPETSAAGLNEKLHEMARHYRARGHLIAALDPLGTPRTCPLELKPDYYGFAESELDLPVNLPTLHLDTPLTVREVIRHLQDIYCGPIGIEFMHIDDLRTREWLQRRIEDPPRHLSRDEQLNILTSLTDAVVFEEFLRKKFLGAKTFSLEGCETLLPLLDLAIGTAGSQGVRDIVMGMAHRGRLNVLAHIAGKDPCAIFREFVDPEPELWQGRGDVKYHLGHSGDWTTASGRHIHLALCFNPSHLEFVNPIVLGRVRARQDGANDPDRRQVLSLLIHGDAAFAGEGIIQETLNLAKLAGYTVGGTLHIIVNNQIGYTTPPEEYRSTPYATGAAHMLQSPIFHVNGENPEAVARVVQVAMDFRREFQSDVFIDMYGYRRWGHNETDEPTFTQPRLYRTIAQRKSVRESYLEHLQKLNGVTVAEAEEIARNRHDDLEQKLNAAAQNECPAKPESRGGWHDYTGGSEPADEPDTGVEAGRLAELLQRLTEIPAGFHLHPKLERPLKLRREMAAGKIPLDWAAGEMLALATLAVEGVRIRLSGQDTVRGTFSHRHAIFYDQEHGHPYRPLQHLAKNQAPVEVLNSPLSEAGALGFEYGYSLDCPAGLVLWEAQFGDFVNVAQVILDQFISSAEDKWQRLSGLVLLLPHGFEGMGPEHSSARIERFLTLAAEDNIQVAQPTTPAQYFHLLRRQIRRRWRKPLVIFTPKSLLRHSRAVSPLEDFSTGRFQRLLPDPVEPREVKRILLCTGKLFYELAAYRDEHCRRDVAIIRLEQLYPLPNESLEQLLRPYADETPARWVQEEPLNMGAWRYLHEKFGRRIADRLPLAMVSRSESASPATGSSGAHKLEQARLIARAFGDPAPDAGKVPDLKTKNDPVASEGRVTRAPDSKKQSRGLAEPAPPKGNQDAHRT